MRFIHIFAGLSALISGAIALYTVKGGKIHRKSGMIFAISMLIMSSSAVVLAVFHSKQDSLVAGLLTFYLILTSLFAVRKFSKIPFWVNWMVLIIGVMTVFFGAKFGFEGIMFAKEKVDSKPVTSLIFGSIALLCLIGDLRFFLIKEFNAKKMLIRHLWRMCFALFLAVASFFLGQAQVFPEQIRFFPFLAIPVILVAIVTIYWILRTNFKKSNLQTQKI